MAEAGDLFSNVYVLSIIILAVVLLFLVILLVWLNKKMKRFMQEEITEIKPEGDGLDEIAKELDSGIDYKRNIKPVPRIENKGIFNESELGLSQKEVLNKARMIIQESRRVGFSDLEIKNKFIEKQWPDEDIEYLLRHTR
jgi:hypothetical protein